MYLSPLISVSSIFEVCCLIICFRSNKNLVKFIRFDSGLLECLVI